MAAAHYLTAMKSLLLCCPLWLLLATSASQVLAQAAPEPHVADVDHRAAMTLARFVDADRQPAFTLDFVLSDVRLDRSDPRRFSNFSGDLSGRFLEVMSVASAHGELDEGALNGFTLEQLADSILAHQQADGRFGDPRLRFTADEIGGEHMALLWGNGRLLVGLMTYVEETGDPDALAAAKRLGDFFIATADACAKPEVVKRLEGFGAKGIICFTQYIEGLVMLAEATGDRRYIDASVQAYAAMPPRGVQHSHGYLSTLRGVVDLYHLTGERTHLDYVQREFDDLLASDDYTLYGGVREYFGPEVEGRDHSGQRDEGCSSADFVRLALQLYEATSQERYREVAHYGIINALLFNQYGSGDFGHHFLAHGYLQPSNPRRSWWCCTMHGLRALQTLRYDYAIRDIDSGAELTLLLPMSFDDEGYRGRIRERPVGDRFTYAVTVDALGEGPLSILLPANMQHWEVSGADGNLSNGRYTLAAPSAGATVRLSAKPVLSILGETGEDLSAPSSSEPVHGALRLGYYLLGTRTDAYVAEPDHANQVDYATLRPLENRVGMTARFREGGYTGMADVEFVPVATQTQHGHGYMRVSTRFAEQPVFRSPDY